MSKCMKVIMILVMVTGIAFSILNFFSGSLIALTGGGVSEQGVWVGDECENFGNLCDLWMEAGG